jgi:hypothetical protein
MQMKYNIKLYIYITASAITLPHQPAPNLSQSPGAIRTLTLSCDRRKGAERSQAGHLAVDPGVWRDAPERGVYGFNAWGFPMENRKRKAFSNQGFLTATFFWGVNQGLARG